MPIDRHLACVNSDVQLGVYGDRKIIAIGIQNSIENQVGQVSRKVLCGVNLIYFGISFSAFLAGQMMLIYPEVRTSKLLISQVFT